LSRLDCERWASLLDREALEQALSTDDRQFQVEHVRGCTECARELVVWQKLEACATTADRELEPDLALEDAVLNQLWSEPSSAKPRMASHVRRVAMVGVAFAAAAAVLLFAWQRGGPPAADSALAHVTIGSGKALAEAGAVRRPGDSVKVGDTLRAGESPICLLIESGVRACLSAGGELRVADAALAHRRLELLRGRLVASLEPQRTGMTFSVSARSALVTAVGTAFAVEVTEQEQVLVRVLHGTVSVRDGAASSAKQRLLRAHQSLVLGVGAPSELAATQEEQDLALLRMDVESTPAARAAEAAPAPASSAGATSTSGVTSPARPAPSASEPSSAADLLRQALELRGRGRFPEAAQVYGKLVAAHPGSQEARAALVSLGDLQLSRLNSAAAALRSFDSYLAGGDRALQQEAEYGRIRALRALGRAAEEQSAIERLLARYPSGVHADSMRARLQSLKGDGSR
jgi:TolA-binding protein